MVLAGEQLDGAGKGGKRIRKNGGDHTTLVGQNHLGLRGSWGLGCTAAAALHPEESAALPSPPQSAQCDRIAKFLQYIETSRYNHGCWAKPGTPHGDRCLPIFPPALSVAVTPILAVVFVACSSIGTKQD